MTDDERTLDEAMGMTADEIAELRAKVDDLEPCDHRSKTGDEGPGRDLPGGPNTIVRWRCDGCGQISYDDDALARLRAHVAALQLALNAVRQGGWMKPERPTKQEAATE